ncbi:MAG: hypothetical protein AAF738_05090 [Bacteroidota bacterium]
MTQIVEIAGTRRSPRVGSVRVRRGKMPRRAYIPYASMSRGEMHTAIMERRYHLLSAVHRNRGDKYMQQQYKAAANYLKGTLISGLHNGISELRGNEMAKSVNKMLKQANNDRMPAIPALSQAAKIGMRTQCDIKNRCKLKNKELDRKIRRDADRLTQEQLGYRRPRLLGRNRKEYCRRFNENFCQLADRFIMEEIINEKLEGAGVSLLYGLMEQDNNYKQVVFFKQQAQSQWIQTTADLTGIPAQDIQAIATNGYIAAIQEEPRDTREKIKLAMYDGFTVSQEDYDKIAVGEPVTFAAVLAFIKVAGPLITSAIGLIKGIINSVRQQRTASAYAGIPNPSSAGFMFEESDLLGEVKPASANANESTNAGADTNTNGSTNINTNGKFLQSNGLLLGGVALALLLSGGLKEK